MFILQYQHNFVLVTLESRNIADLPKEETNAVAFSTQANYRTDRASAACRQS
jgi:hypothetical protein